MSNTILTPNRIHGCIVPTPSGPSTLAHYVLARAVHNAVHYTGGTFVIIIDDLLAFMALETARDPVGERAPEDLRPAVEYWADELLANLKHFGIEPSPEDELRAQGFNWPFPEHRPMGVKWQSDSTLTDHYYSVFGLERDFGRWPLPSDPMQLSQTDSLYFATNVGLGPSSQVHITHAWVVLSWAVDEMSTGRNVALDGEDLTTIVGQFGEHAQRLHNYTGWAIPRHLTMPTILGRSSVGNVLPLSSSNCIPQNPNDNTCPYILLGDAVEAGVDRESLDAYVDEHLIKPGKAVEKTAPNYSTALTYREEVANAAANWLEVWPRAMKSNYIIDERDWRRFLRTGKVKPPKKKAGKR